jgi:TubC N-terminal docking domain
VNARDLLENLRSRVVNLEVDGECLFVDAPVGEITEEARATLTEQKLSLLKLLTWEQRKLEEADRRGLVIRWSEYPDWIKLHDPTSGEWHEVRVEECLPGVVETANKYRKKKGGPT